MRTKVSKTSNAGLNPAILAKRRGFVDMTDWEFHFDDTQGVAFFDTEKQLLNRKSCCRPTGSEHCGIVEVEIRVLRVVQREKMHGETQEESPL